MQEHEGRGELLAANYNLEWQALMRALSRYNSGSPTRAEAYAKRVVGQAQRNARMPSLALHPLIDARRPCSAPQPRHAPPTADLALRPASGCLGGLPAPEAPVKPPGDQAIRRAGGRSRGRRAGPVRGFLWGIDHVTSGRTLAVAGLLLALRVTVA